jgi:hypothetical protein
MRLKLNSLTKLIVSVVIACGFFNSLTGQTDFLSSLVYDSSKTYEEGDSVIPSIDLSDQIYTARKSVPLDTPPVNSAGEISNPDYWATSGDYTADLASQNSAQISDVPDDAIVDTSEVVNLETPSEDTGDDGDTGGGGSNLQGGRLINLSTRGYVGTGERRLIGGFKVYGANLDILVRGFGPSHNLSNKSLDDPLLVWKTNPTSLLPSTSGIVSEVDDADPIANPRLSGVSASTQELLDVLINDETADIQTASNWSNERVNGYTAYIVAKEDNESGVGRIGINDLSDFTGLGQLVNISTRGYVGDDDDHYLIAGFRIRGGSIQVCVRAFGPSMSLAGEESLSDPVLEIIQQVSDYHTEKKVLHMNDNWKEDFTGVTDITPFNITSQKTTIPYYLNNMLQDNEAALTLTLEPGDYTARVYGKNGGKGIGRVGIDKIVDEWNIPE